MTFDDPRNILKKPTVKIYQWQLLWYIPLLLLSGDLKWSTVLLWEVLVERVTFSLLFYVLSDNHLSYWNLYNILHASDITKTPKFND